jgi:4-hydroxyphenylacetate 3-monooxygenase
MGARTGKEYVEGLRDDREVWLGGARVADVTSHPAFAGALATMSDLYDLQHDAADVCLTPDPDVPPGSGDPETGALVNRSIVIPRSRDDLERRHVALRRTAEHTVGLMGRTPDYLNVTVAGFAGRSDVWGALGNEEGAQNLVSYHRELARRDLALTHTIVHPTIDKGVPETAAADGAVALHKVGDTEHGIVVRGARVLATLAPFSDELLVYTGQPIPKDAASYALSFAIPMSTPGLKVLCRDDFSVPGDRFDHPLSSRFDEQDAFVIFDNVEVPRDRVFIDANLDVYNYVMSQSWWQNIMQQTTVRAQTKLEFAWGIATQMVESINARQPQNLSMLGEIWSYAELTRAALQAAVDGAADAGNGTWLPDKRPFTAIRATMPGWMVRTNEIIRQLGAHHIFTTPARGELDDPVLRPLLDHYLRGTGGVDAERRARIYRLAWDFSGSGLASRNEQYERFYLGSESRNYMMAHMLADRTGADRLVARFLDESLD